MATSLTVPTKEWSGAAGRTLLQGLILLAGYRIVIQADTVAGQKEQDVWIRIHSSKNQLLATCWVKRAGHGSTVGAEIMPDGSIRFWLGHKQLNTSGYATWKPGQTGALTFTKQALPYGDISIDQESNQACLRNGNRYRVYDLATVKAGDRKKLYDFTIPAWGERFQGHLWFRGNLATHRDVETKGKSMAHRYQPTSPTTAKEVGHLDTSSMGDEAEGLCVDGDTIDIVKRTGGDNSGRYLQATPWVTIQKEQPVASKIKYRNGYTCECVIAVFPLFEAECIARGLIKESIDVSQWSYSTAVAKSSDTHAGGGVFDTEQYSDPILAVARSWSIELQRRTPAQGFVLHGHGVVKGCPHVSKGRTGAEWQLSEWEAGRNGLKGKGKITGPGPIGKATPTWQQAIARKAANRAKTLQQWIAELGQVKSVSADAINENRGSGNSSRHTAQMQAWLNLALPADLLVVDGIWSAQGPTQSKLNEFRAKILGWKGKDTLGEVGAHSLTLLHDQPAVLASKPLPVKEPYPTKK